MQEILDQIEKVKSSNKLIIVEGINDIKALDNLEIFNTVEIKGALVLFAEKIATYNKDIILLTDLDIEGNKLFKTLNHHLCQMGVRVDYDFRKYLKKRTGLKVIERIDKYVEKKKDNIHLHR